MHQHRGAPANRVGLGPGSGLWRVRAVIFKLFRAFFGLIFSMLTKNIFIFFSNIFAVFFFFNVYSVASTRLDYFFIVQEWHNSEVTNEHCVSVKIILCV